MKFIDPEYNLPKGWNASEIQELAEIHNNRRKPINSLTRVNMRGIYPYCGANNIVDYINKYEFDGEYVLIAEDGGYWGRNENTSYIMKGKFWVNNHAHIIRAKDGKTTNQYLSFVLNYLNFNPIIGGDARGKLTKAVLTKLLIPHPSYNEQRKIAYVLSTVQKAIEQQDKLISTTTELKKALMQKLFTEGTRGEPQKETEIGLVPKSWEVRKVGEIANVFSGGTPSRTEKSYWENGTIPWIKTGEIDYCLIIDSEEKITEVGYENSSAKLCKNGTLLMAMYGQGITRGKVAILGLDATINQACAAIVPKNENQIKTKFLYYFFEKNYESIRNLGHGANQKNISGALIKSIDVAFPISVQEQNIIIEALELFDKKKQFLNNKKQTLTALFKTLLHELMTGQRRVHELGFEVLQSKTL